jgi:glycosyltransferase involved in cell wall biosynthesis
MAHRILFITHTFPLPDLDGGSLRTLRLMQMLGALGWQVTNLSTGHVFHPAYTARSEEARALLAANDIAAAGPAAPLDYLAGDVAFDCIWLAVVPGNADFVAQLRRRAPQAVLIFDTIELTFVSMMRAAQLQRSEQLIAQARRVQASQLQLAAAADYTLVVTAEEADLLRRLCPEANVHIISNVHEVIPGAPSPAGRRDLLFVGNYVHRPNRDAAQHFVADIWPQVRARSPGAVVRFVGLPTPEVSALAAPDVLITGHAPDLAPYYAASRVAIAPLRFGAGIKGKVLEAMGYGLPVVMTPVAAEGINARPGDDALIATTPASFAAAIVTLYTDDALWHRLAHNGQFLVTKCFSFEQVKLALTDLLSMAMRK